MQRGHGRSRWRRCARGFEHADLSMLCHAALGPGRGGREEVVDELVGPDPFDGSPGVGIGRVRAAFVVAKSQEGFDHRGMLFPTGRQGPGAYRVPLDQRRHPRAQVVQEPVSRGPRHGWKVDGAGGTAVEQWVS